MNIDTGMMERLITGIESIYGSLLISIILYGSVARGTAQSDSDIDIAVLLEDGHTKEMRDKLTDLIVDRELEYDKVLSVLRIDYKKYKEWEDIMPFYKNMKKDGVILWRAA